MTQCFYCANGRVTTPPGSKSFAEFVDMTSVTCKLGKKTGCNYCNSFKDVDDVKPQTEKEKC